MAGTKTKALRLGYAAGPFNMAGAWGTTEVNPSVDGDNWNVAGSWKTGFGMFSAFYGSLEVGPVEQTNWFLGYQLPIGAFTLKASYGEVERTGVPASVGCTPPLDASVTAATCMAGGDADQLALGFVYDLSKRTALYGTYSMVGNSGTRFRAGQLENNAAVYDTLGKASTGYEFGVRHSF